MQPSLQVNNQKNEIGHLCLGIRNLTVNDLVKYSEEKTFCGRVFVAIKLFFLGKGIISDKGIKGLLKEHPISDELIRQHPQLEKILKVHGIAMTTIINPPANPAPIQPVARNITLEMVKMVDTGAFCLESSPCQHDCTITLKDNRQKAVRLSGPDIWSLVKFLPQDKFRSIHSFGTHENAPEGHGVAITRDDSEVLLSRLFQN